jgi:hypothetical protein
MIHACAVAVVAALAGAASTPSATGDAGAGERLYRTGFGASGAPVPAVLRGDVRSNSATLPCASCHLGSGFGSTEGGQVAPAVRWHRLSAPGSNSRGPRRAYDPRTLVRAVTEGLDSEGRPLSPLMPRYALGATDAANLGAFLRARGRPVAEGIRDGHLRLAAVVTPDADPARLRAMEAVLARFTSHANPRFGRGSHGPPPRGPDGKPAPQVRGYRGWELAIWTLAGPPESWRKQLDTRQAAAPAFALVSGLGGATWGPVHKFCEERRIPCVLPNVDAPPRGRPAWSVYYSGGVELEAEVMAKEIPADARIAQVSRRGTVGAAGAGRLRALRRVVDLEPGAPVPGDVDALVLWTAPAGSATDLARSRARTWISGTVAGAVAAPPDATVVRSWADASRVARGERFARWAQASGVAPGDFRIQEQTFFACQLVAHALSHMRDDLDREHLLEQIEHTTGMEAYSASYPNLSFGPGQRFLSKGAYVAKADEAAAVGEWVVP